MTKINFTLSEGWKVNSPWGNKEIIDIFSTLRGSIFYLGAMDWGQHDEGSIPFSLGTYGLFEKDKYAEIEQLVIRVIKNSKDIMGFEPYSRAPYWAVNVGNHIPSSSGMAGFNSLITGDNYTTIAHEIFHWWNWGTINYTEDAEWIKEGFTSYYADKILRNTGYLTDTEFNTKVGALNSAYNRSYSLGKANLVEISRKFSKGQATQREISAIYNGGAMVGYFLDEELKQENKSLDDIWSKLYEYKKPISSKDFFKTLRDLGGEELSKKYSNIVNGKTALLK